MLDLKQQEKNTGQTGISYILARKDVKNINIRIRPDGTVYVSAGPRVPLRVIEHLLEQKAQWIQTVQRRIQATNVVVPQPRQYCSGESFYYLGQEVPLVVQRENNIEVYLENGNLVLSCPEPEAFATREMLIKKWYSKQARLFFEPLCAQIHSSFFEGMPEPQLRLRFMKSQWGNCRAGQRIITLNTRLIMVPYECIEYVVMHEFAHLIEQNHSSRFYAVLERMLPEHQQRRNQLKQWGPLVLPI